MSPWRRRLGATTPGVKRAGGIPAERRRGAGSTVADRIPCGRDAHPCLPRRGGELGRARARCGRGAGGARCAGQPVRRRVRHRHPAARVGRAGADHLGHRRAARHRRRSAAAAEPPGALQRAAPPWVPGGARGPGGRLPLPPRPLGRAERGHSRSRRRRRDRPGRRGAAQRGARGLRRGRRPGLRRRDLPYPPPRRPRPGRRHGARADRTAVPVGARAGGRVGVAVRPDAGARRPQRWPVPRDVRGRREPRDGVGPGGHRVGARQGRRPGGRLRGARGGVLSGDVREHRRGLLRRPDRAPRPPPSSPRPPGVGTAAAHPAARCGARRRTAADHPTRGRAPGSRRAHGERARPRRHRARGGSPAADRRSGGHLRHGQCRAHGRRGRRARRPRGRHPAAQDRHRGRRHRRHPGRGAGPPSRRAGLGARAGDAGPGGLRVLVRGARALSVGTNTGRRGRHLDEDLEPEAEPEPETESELVAEDLAEDVVTEEAPTVDEPAPPAPAEPSDAEPADSTAPIKQARPRANRRRR